MKPIFNKTLLSFLLAIGLAGSVNGQANDQLGFICVLKGDQNSLPRVFKVDMGATVSIAFSWNTEEWRPRKSLTLNVDYIRHPADGDSPAFYIDRTTLDGASVFGRSTHSCSLNTWSEVDAFVQREVSRLNNTRAF